MSIDAENAPRIEPPAENGHGPGIEANYSSTIAFTVKHSDCSSFDICILGSKSTSLADTRRSLVRACFDEATHFVLAEYFRRIRVALVRWLSARMEPLLSCGRRHADRLGTSR
jgi:hypothetical protein